jgi:hypothetical protein
MTFAEFERILNPPGHRYELHHRDRKYLCFSVGASPWTRFFLRPRDKTS